MQSKDQSDATANDPISALRENLARIAEKLTVEIEPATIYVVPSSDREPAQE
ncbi:MAG TPA: hypothetical protein VMF91_01650 [Bryobacteraceae bacterium]|nr:hypothetical protein [Bryobacteraceae bacterium]